MVVNTTLGLGTSKSSSELKKICKIIDLHINIDGIPLFKSSCESFWPILGCICEMKHLNTKSCIIALWFGKSKPENVNFIK